HRAGAVPDRRGARGAQAGGGGAAARRSPRAPGEGGGGEAVTTPRRAAGADPFGGRWTRRGHRGPCHRGPTAPEPTSRRSLKERGGLVGIVRRRLRRR